MSSQDVCGARVHFGAVPAPPAAAAVDVTLWSGEARLVADRRRAHLDVRGAGRFAIAGGAEVTVEPAAGGDDGLLRNVLHGTVAALVLAQRGTFALHASTVAVRGAGLALAGPSGAGKSTAALALERQGHRLVADDVSPVHRAAGGRPEVVPFGRARHVWPDTAAALGIDLTGSRLVDRRLSKLALPAPAGAPARLAAVIVLRPDPAAAAVTVARLDGLAAVPVLLDNAYRVRLLARLWAADLLGWAAELSGQVAVWVLRRPPGRWTVDEVADAIAALGAGAAHPVAAGRPG